MILLISLMSMIKGGCEIKAIMQILSIKVLNRDFLDFPDVHDSGGCEITAIMKILSIKVLNRDSLDFPDEHDYRRMRNHGNHANPINQGSEP